MDSFVECEACGFVLLAESGSDPLPERVDSCPDCGGAEFAFTDG